MSVENTEENPGEVSQESAVCVGDGTTCVECGKVFTHPFYFSTHIGTHTNQREFVVVGQCALCGLVFSSAAIFAAHLSSSQTRLEIQVTPQEENEAADDYYEVKSELTSQNDSRGNNSLVQNDLADNKQAVKRNSPTPHSSEATTKGKVTTDITVKNETSLKRKRKAPQRFEVDSGPQLFQIPSDADPEVEAYLLSLKEMGLTVDPAAFSSHRGGKRRRKGSESAPGKGKGKGRQEMMWAADAMDFSPDMQSPKKASPKYEYLDSDDSFEDDPEILPVSGKLTRGQRLQQRLERLSQSKESGIAGSTKKQSHAKDNTLIKDEADTLIKDEADTLIKDEADTLIKDEVDTLLKDETDTLLKDEPSVNTAEAETALVDNPQRADVPKAKLNTHTTTVKCTKPTSGPGIVKKEIKSVPVVPVMRNLNRTPSVPNSGGKNIVHRTLPQPNLNRFNTVRALAVPHTIGRNNHNRISTLPNMNNSHIFQAHSAGNARNIGQKALRFPQGDVRGRKGDAAKFPGTSNVQKSSSLEDLKKNSRENVEQMLQSIGMMAVTSSAMIQGKIFSSQKKSGEIAFPPVRSMGASGIYRPSFPHRGFPSRPFRAPETMAPQQTLSYRGQSRFSSKQIAGRGQTGSYAALANSHNNPRARHTVSAHTLKAGSTTGEFSYPQSVGHGRGTGVQRTRGQHQQNNVRGIIKSSTVSLRGKARSVTSPVPSMGPGTASSVHRQTKPGQGSSEIIVIDDDDIQNALGDIKLKGKPYEFSQKSTSRHINTGKVNILDVDLNSEASNIEVIEDKTQGSSPAATIVTMGEEDNPVQLPDHDSDDLQDVENESEPEIDSSNSIKNSENLSTDEACDSQAVNADSKCTSKNVEVTVSCQVNVSEDTVILPGEDIAGWKVCLAENSDSNEEFPSLSNNAKKSSIKDQHLSTHNSPEQDCPSSVEVKMVHNGSKLDDFSLQGSNLDPENVKLIHSETDALLTHYVSASAATTEKQSVCVLQDNSVCNHSPDKACCEEQYTQDKDVSARAVDILLTPHNPTVSECDAVSSEKEQIVSTTHSLKISECDSVTPDLVLSNPNDRSSTENNVTGCIDIISEENEDQQLSTIDMKDDSTENTFEHTVIPLNPDLTLTNFSSSAKCLVDRVTESQEPLLDLNTNGSCSVSVPHDSSVKLDHGNKPSEMEDSIEEYPTQKETTTVGRRVKDDNTDRKQHTEFAFNDGQMDDVKSYLPSVSINNKVLCGEEKANSILSVSENKCLETDNGELLPGTETLCSTPLIDCKDKPTTDNEDFVNGTVSSESSTSQAAIAVPGNFLKDVSSLLDIFTEIEKTCKEMEETQEVERGSRTVLPPAEGDMESVSSDIVEHKMGNVILPVKVAESSNDISSSKGETQETCRDSDESDLPRVKEAVDDRSKDNINEDVEKIEEVEYGCANDNSKKKNDMEIGTTGSEHSVTASYQETRHTSEED